MVGCNIFDPDYYLAFSILQYFSNHCGDSLLDYYKNIQTEYGHIGIEETNLKTILNELCKRNYMHKLLGTCDENTRYYASMGIFDNFDKETAANILNCFCFGPRYIYKSYKDNVKLIRGVTLSGDPISGSCFICGDSIYTAAHCVRDVKNIEIDGFTKEEIKKAKVYISNDKGIDVAIIQNLNLDCYKKAFFQDASVLDEVIVMGYPIIPCFQEFLTVEKANISSVGEMRFAATEGSIAAIERSYLDKSTLMLVTAKIRGGNSGGPVINNHGFFVGITIQVPDYKDNKDDDLGYGVCLPYQTIKNAIEGGVFKEHELLWD